jgi:hypothetical protein
LRRLWGAWMRRVSFVLAAALAVFLTSGCAYTDHFDDRLASYDISTEQARDQMILTNVVRASRAEPLAFQSIGTLLGQTSAGGTLGLPSLVLGPKGALTSAQRELDAQSVFGANPNASGAIGNSVNTAVNTSFNLTPNETKDFYRGLLLTVAPETLGFFSDQGIAPETLFYLFTENVTETRAGKINQYVNDPLYAESFAHFQRYVALASQYALTAEPQPGLKVAKPKTTGAKEDAKAEEEIASSAEYRLCFDRSRWAPGTPFAHNRPLCGSKDKMPDERTVSFVDQQGVSITVRVAPRSTFSIFQYLGRLVAEGEAGLIKLKTEAATGRPPLFDDNFFLVQSDGAGGPCFLAVNYEGRNYCVPTEDARNTKRILGLLVQLLALSTEVRDISNVGQVQVIGQ